MSIHCEKCGQAKYLSKLLPKIQTSMNHFLDMLRRIELEVAPHSKTGGTSRGAAERVLAILMDDREYMEASTKQPGGEE